MSLTLACKLLRYAGAEEETSAKIFY